MIVGRTDMNRAMDGDVVAVELLQSQSGAGPEPKSQSPERNTG